jgi:alpha-1,3-fucosyltransferase
MEETAKNYKFYLSFENSVCRDYISEKFWKALNNNIVPVVLGGADYSRVAPPKSYINVMVNIQLTTSLLVL